METAIFASMKKADKMPPVFSPHLFWDMDLSKIDFERDKNKVIRRAFEYGTLTDIGEVMRVYPVEQVKKSLTEAVYLPENAIYLASALFGLKINDFTCSTSRQLHPLF